MRTTLAIAAITLLSASAQSQEPTIVDACLKVAEMQLGHDDLEATNVQSFPELSPPRARMDIQRTVQGSGNEIADMLDNLMSGSGADDFTRDYGEVQCEFQNASSPFVLTHFVCFAGGCGELYMDKTTRQRRVEELGILLERAGY